ECKVALQNNGKVLARKVFNNDKVTDHHAIIPTDERPTLANLSADERKLYDMIVRRFLALFYPIYRYETINVSFQVGDESFSATESSIIEIGFKAVTGKSDEEVYIEHRLDNLRAGQTFTVNHIQMDKKWTEPPLRYSEADLLSKMEKYGLGTPATRADIIEKLLTSETLDRVNNRL